MGLNDELLDNKSQVSKKRKINSKKVYGITLSIIVFVLFLTGGLVIFQNLYYEVAFFQDYSMAPSINKTITNNGEVVDPNNFKSEDGNIVEYGLIDRHFSKETLKRFQIIVLDNGYNGTMYSFPTFRIVGLPGETIKLDYDGNLYVNDILTDQPIPKEYLELDWSNNSGSTSNMFFYEELDDDEYYLLKDYRKLKTQDSRNNGGYKFKQIYGVVKTINGVCTINGSRCVNRTRPFPRFI